MEEGCLDRGQPDPALGGAVVGVVVRSHDPQVAAILREAVGHSLAGGEGHRSLNSG